MVELDRAGGAVGPARHRRHRPARPRHRLPGPRPRPALRRRRAQAGRAAGRAPPDVGRGWEPNDSDRPARLDLDGDGEKEEVTFRGEPTEQFDGRYRLETTLSSTGEEAYGIVEVGTTVATNVLDPIDADGDGDQELVLYYDDAEAVGGGGHPLVLDLRDGLLVQAVPEDPDLLVRGNVPVPDSRTEFYEMVRIHDYWFEDGTAAVQQSQRAYASGNMSLVRTETILVDTWRWTLDDDGVLRPESLGCVRSGLEASVPCEAGEVEELPYLTPVATETFGIGEGADFREGYRFSARLEAAADPSLVVEGDDGRTHQRRAGGRRPAGLHGAADLGHVRRCLVLRHVRVRPHVRRGARAGRGRAASAPGRRGGPTQTCSREGGACGRGSRQDGVRVRGRRGGRHLAGPGQWMMVTRPQMAALPSATVASTTSTVRRRSGTAEARTVGRTC